MSAFPQHLQGLLHPPAYPHPVQAVQLVETHISWILLTGEFAYKTGEARVDGSGLVIEHAPGPVSRPARL